MEKTASTRLVQQPRRFRLVIAGVTLSLLFFGDAQAQPLAEIRSRDSITITVSVAPRVRLEHISPSGIGFVGSCPGPAPRYKSSHPNVTVRVYVQPVESRSSGEHAAYRRDSAGPCDITEGFLADQEARGSQKLVAIIAAE